MTNAQVNLESLAYDKASFAHSQREATSMDPKIRGPRPYYYMWRGKDGRDGMDILTFEDPTKPQTAKLFRYTKEQIHSGVDLERDTPAFIGDEVVRVLQEYAGR